MCFFMVIVTFPGADVVVTTAEGSPSQAEAGTTVAIGLSSMTKSPNLDLIMTAPEFIGISFPPSYG
jgi:hypothetical protein